MALMDRVNAQQLPALPPIDERGVLDKLVAVARYTGVPQLVGLSFEGMRRLDAGFRTGILTARGVIPPKEFPDYWRRAMSGELKELTTSEFNKLFLGSQLYEQARDTPLIPGWTKQVLNPETQLMEDRPVLSVGSVLDFAADVWASPLTYLMAGGPTAVRIASKTPFWSPFRAMGRGIGVLDNFILGTEHKFPIFGHLLMHARELRHAMSRWPKVVTDFQDTRDGLAKAMIGWGPRWHNLFYKESRGAFGRKRATRLFSPESEKAVMNELHRLNVPGVRTKLTPAELELRERIMDEMEPLIRRAQDMGFVPKTWKRSDGLADMMPNFVNLRSIPADVLQSWDMRTLGILRVPLWYSKKEKQLKRMKITAKNLDLQSSLADFTYAIEKKLHWNARHKEAVIKKAKLADGTVVEKAVPKWVNTGPLTKYASKKTHLYAQQNPNTRDWSMSERSYVTRLINEIQGKGRGRPVLELGEISRRMAYNMQDFAGKNRITKKIFERLIPDEAGAKLGVYAKPQYATQFFVHNVVRSMLWANLGGAIKNTSQLLNTATIKGIPATFKGMFELSNPERWALAKTEVWHEFKRLTTDERFHKKFGSWMDDVMMKPFNAVENFARGTAFNVYLDDYMKTHRIPSFEALMKHAKRDEAIRYAVNGTYDTNFIYGVLGRPASVLGSPIVRPFTTLLSFGPKQLEFYRMVAKNDGGALLRALGMHGLAIDMGNKWLGIAPESFLGWGFAPPMQSIDGIPLMASPQLRWALDVARGMAALGGGNEAEAAAHFRRAQGAVGQVLDLSDAYLDAYGQGLLSPGVEAFRAVVAAGPQLGLFPAPIVAMAKTADAVQMLRTYDPATGVGRKPTQTGEAWVPITRADAARSILFQTTTAAARHKLNQMTRDARNRVDRVLDERVRAYLTAAEGDNGDRLVEAARELTSPIRISHGLVRQPPTTYIPMMEQIDSRLRRLSKNRTQSRDLTAMMDNGFLQDIYWASWIDLMLRTEGLQ